MVSNKQPRNQKFGPRDNTFYDHIVVGIVVSIGIGILVGIGAVALIGIIVVICGGGEGIGIIGVIGTGFGVIGIFVRIVIGRINVDLRRTPELRRRDRGPVALRLATWLLPTEARQDYAEEWRLWWSDLREAGEPRYRRLAELLTILLIAAPKLAVILRLGRRRAVD